MKHIIETAVIGTILSGLIIYVAGAWLVIMGDRPRAQRIDGRVRVVRPTPIPVSRSAPPKTQKVVFPPKVWDR